MNVTQNGGGASWNLGGGDLTVTINPASEDSNQVLGPQPAGFDNSNGWLSTSCADFVNNLNLTDDGPDAITGCLLCFIYYLFGSSVSRAIRSSWRRASGRPRSQMFTAVSTGPFLFFKRLVDTALPGTSTGNLDNPFPIGILSC